MRVVSSNRCGAWCLIALLGLVLTPASVEGQARRVRGAPRETPAGIPATQPTTTQATTGPASAPTTTAPKLVPLSFNNAQLTEIAKVITDQFGKPVIIAEKVRSKTITLTNPKPLPAPEAMDVLLTALQDAGITIEERQYTVHLIPIEEAAQAQIRIVGPEVDVDTLKPANQIVRKVFQVRHYDAVRMMDVVRPLLPEWSAKTITADGGSGQIIIVSTVERLRLVGGVMKQLDVPGVTGGELRVFPIKNVDVTEVTPLLEKLLSGYLGMEIKAVTTAGVPTPSGRGSDRDRMERMMMERMGGSGGPSPPPGGAVTVKAEKTPVMLIPEPRRSAIVVVAPQNVLLQIEGWLKYLDQPRPPKTQTELVPIRYGDATEIVNQLTTMLNNIPDDSLRSTIRLFPFAASGRIMIVGPEGSRELIKNWLAEIDIPEGGNRVTQTFELKNSDAQEIADNVKELFQDSGAGRSRYYFFYDYYDRGRGGDSDRNKVTVTANARSNSITVVASAEMMIRIAAQIKEWDKPFAGDEALPRIYNLKYADPDKTKTLLESLFTKQEELGQRYYWWDDDVPTGQSPVGRLFGQFRFEAYPDTGKLIAVSKNEENYRIIDRMIEEIDSPQAGGLPRIIQLKFADAETLAEQLNALLNAPGTPASILRRGQTGYFQQLEDRGSPMARDQSSTDAPRNQGQNQQQRGAASGEMQFWWQNPPSDLVKNRQPSNLIGKMRIVPNVEQNLLMVVAPTEFADDIEEFVATLDRPGQQVLIKGLIAEITHDDTMSLGFRFSSDPTAFTTGADQLITQNALRGIFTYSYEDMFGQENTVTFDVDVNNVLNLLHQITKVKIRSEPKVFTADNVEAEFFDGQDVPFITDSTFSGVSGVQNQSFDYREVGIRLRVRPHITKERNIDLTVNLLISNIVPGKTLFGGAIVDRRETTTRIVLEDGHTFMISGILREDERVTTQGIPGLSDIPFVGEVFKHRQTIKVNSEVLIFLTPYVLGPSEPHTFIESDPLNKLREKMDLDEEFGPVGDPQDKPESGPASKEKRNGR